MVDSLGRVKSYLVDTNGTGELVTDSLRPLLHSEKLHSEQHNDPDL
jgi:hypothetical protein